MKKRLSSIVGLCSFLLLSLFTISAFAAPPAAAVKPAVSGQVSPQTVHAVDIPVIQYFNVQAKAVQGDPLNFSWSVLPGPGGSPITKVAISITLNNATILVKPGQPQNQTATIPANIAGNLTYVLTATNSANKTTTLNKPVHVFTINEVKNNLKIFNMEGMPQVFLANQPIDFRLTVHNNNPMPLYGANIFVMQGTRVVANLTNQNLNPGFPTYLLKDNGYQATGGNYIVDLEYKGVHFNKVFKIKPVTSFTIDPM